MPNLTKNKTKSIILNIAISKTIALLSTNNMNQILECFIEKCWFVRNGRKYLFDKKMQYHVLNWYYK